MEIQDSIIFSKNPRSIFTFSPLQQLIIKLKRADQSSQCLTHLENLRLYIKTRSRFQRKVNSALLQVRIQSCILFMIYSGLFCLILYQYGLKYKKVLLFSFCLFLLGLISLFHCGKKIKMDYLAPPLNAVLQIQLHIKSGLSVRTAIQLYVQEFPKCPFAKQIELWRFHIETGQSYNNPELLKKNYRTALLKILERGLKGEPILTFLQDFQEELTHICLQELDQQVQKLPFLTLIPLFLFQVPAFFLLLLGPLVLELQKKSNKLKKTGTFLAIK